MMAFMKRITCALLLACPFLTEAAPPHVVRDLNSFIATERPRALQGILDNIGPDGTLAHGAKPGIGEHFYAVYAAEEPWY